MSWFSSLSPVRYFPSYPGPHMVGTCDVELPASELDAPSDSPDTSIGTVSFRIFYPCQPTPSSRPVRWVPSPQSKYVAAYARFLGATPRVSEFLSIFPQFLYMTQIPVLRNAPLLEPSTTSGRWPVVVFSHGLGGSRNAYSHLCGSLASNGVVVIAADHRDMSAPISFIRATDNTEAKTIGYQKMPHKPSPEVYEYRDHQLRIRLWELGLLHDAIVKIDLGTAPKNLDPNAIQRGERQEMLPMFVDQLDLHRPGSVIWAGHSFGAATTVQLLKHTYYGPPAEEKGEFDESLFTPRRSASLVKQITPQSVAILLDMWCLPLRSRTTRWLWEKQMPCYESSNPAGGAALLTVLSQAFVEWTGNLNDTKHSLMPKTQAPNSQVKWTPYAFYPETAAHLSQSDFGILFPWLMARFLKVKDPERLMRLNVRAAMQLLRNNGVEVSAASKEDVEGDGPAPAESDRDGKSSQESLVLQDTRILNTKGQISGWLPISMEAPGNLHTEEDYTSPSDELDEAQALDLQGAANDRAKLT